MVMLFHFTKSMLGDLKEKLEVKLQAADSKEITGVNDIPEGDERKVAIVHGSRWRDVAKSLGRFDLVIYYVQGGGGPRERKGDLRGGKREWECGTEVLLGNFESLKKHLETSACASDWRFDGWLPRYPEELVAWYLVQVALEKMSSVQSTEPAGVAEERISQDAYGELASIRVTLESEAKKHFNESPYRTKEDLFGKETVERIFRQMAAS
jgi:hypothetical protein